MMKGVALALGVVLTVAGPGPAISASGEKTYDLLFRDGTLDPVSRAHMLVYRRDVTNVMNPDAAARDSGEIGLRIEQAEDMEMVRLEFRRDGKHRGMGSFPASVGNPMIMVFYESVVRDMAETAGGSPFYIRNRVKDALVQPSEVEPGTAMVNGSEVATRTIRLRPFEGDPNVHRMRGFGAMELSVTMSEAVPGWYLSMVAEAAAADGSGPIYRSRLKFDGKEALQ